MKQSHIRGAIFAASLALLGSHSWAVNKCIAADGKVSFQDAECPLKSQNSRDDLAESKKSDAQRNGENVMSPKQAAAALQAKFEAEMKKPRPSAASQSTSEQREVAFNSAESMPMSQCRATVERTILSLGLTGRNVLRIVDSAVMTVTKMCSVDGSVMITCSAPDQKMVITQGARCN